MRAIPRPLTARTASAPIETIVFVFVLATLSYFYILSAIRQSTYFALSAPNNLRPAYALLTDSEWVPVSGKDWFKAPAQLELQPIVFSFDNIQVGTSLFLGSVPITDSSHRTFRNPFLPFSSPPFPISQST